MKCCQRGLVQLHHTGLEQGLATKKPKLNSPNLTSVMLKQCLCFGGGIGLPSLPGIPFLPQNRLAESQCFKIWSFKAPIQQTPPRRGSSYSQLHFEAPPSLCHSSEGKYPAGPALKQEQPVRNASQSQEIQLCYRKIGNTPSPCPPRPG